VPYPTISNTYRCALKWQATGIARPAINVMHLRKSGSSALAVFNELDAKVTAAMWQYADQNTGVYEVDVTPLDGTSATAQYATGLPTKWKGGVVGGDTIPQVACIVKLGTATRGRSFRGRLYLPYVTEGKQANGVMDATTLAAMQTAFNTFFAALTTDGFEWVVASYKESVATAVTGVILESRTATQRRRQVR